MTALGFGKLSTDLQTGLVRTNRARRWLSPGSCSPVGRSSWCPLAGPSRPVHQDLMPSEALDRLLAIYRGERVFHSANWGGYLTWHGWDLKPRFKTWIDDRLDVHGREHTDSYRSLLGAPPDWEWKPVQRARGAENALHPFRLAPWPSNFAQGFSDSGGCLATTTRWRSSAGRRHPLRWSSRLPGTIDPSCTNLANGKSTHAILPNRRRNRFNESPSPQQRSVPSTVALFCLLGSALALVSRSSMSPARSRTVNVADVYRSDCPGTTSSPSATLDGKDPSVSSIATGELADGRVSLLLGVSHPRFPTRPRRCCSHCRSGSRRIRAKALAWRGRPGVWAPCALDCSLGAVVGAGESWILDSRYCDTQPGILSRVR